MLPESGDSSQVHPVIDAVPSPPRDPVWNYTDLLLLMGFIAASAALIVLASGVLVALRPDLRDDPTPLLLPVQLAFYALVYLGLHFTLSIRYGRAVFSALGWRRVRMNLGVVALGGAALAFVISLLASLLHTPQVPSPLDRFLKSPVNLALFSILAVTLAPLFEELLFRGFLQPLLSRTFGLFAGILITAALFGSLHAPEYSWAWQYVVAVSLAGAVFGWIRARTNSIIPSTLMHSSYNFVFVVALIATKHLKH
ncbi:MAG: CPBP family intramembrane metalloprotease [Acidobacteriaceae bacterium]|nr:CPBP family intramembrane metalloprotease [Acidobacteriaceae bacterium]MBV9779304.1 CPBP family intramembrane metalloprotease [Acidobacteriaceae bacterium]